MHAQAPEPAGIQPQRFGVDRSRVRRLATLVMLLFVGIRAAAEIAMMREVGPDAQMAIWQAYMIVVTFLWLAGGTLAVAILWRLWPRPVGSSVALAILIVWALAIGRSSWEYNRARIALADAANLATSPKRLSELVHFDGIQSGYELDNRLASNWHTPPEALRELSQRTDQDGTLLVLARNPRTPEDVKAQIAPQVKAMSERLGLNVKRKGGP